MMSSPLVSIVLPTYNGMRYLDQSVRSCLDQTYSNWELIIVDDGSTDETPACIAEYVAADSRIRAVRHEVNRNTPTALNTGFSLAKGEYFTWTSDDNMYRPEALSEMVAFLESRCEVGIVYTDYTDIDEMGRSVQRVSIWDSNHLLVRCCVRCSFLYRRQVHEDLNGYDEAAFPAGIVFGSGWWVCWCCLRTR